jgi:CRISPR-associated protein Cmr2
MQRDFWSAFSIIQADNSTQRQALDALLGSGQPPDALSHLTRIADWAARVQLLAQALPTQQKDYARAGTRQTPGGLARLYGSEQFDRYLSTQRETYLEPLRLLPVLPDLGLFPSYSFALCLKFTLRTPYISKDDTAIQLFDNPVKKEWAFKSPYAAGSQWKGVLRTVMLRQLADWWVGLSEAHQNERRHRKKFVARRIQLARLFGAEKGVQIDDSKFEYYLDKRGGVYLARWYRRYVRRYLSPTGFFAGRLHFYPTFFDKIGLELINPHDRKTGAGAQPIYFECVPVGAQGTFVLLYVLFGPTEQSKAGGRAEVAQDLEALTEGIQAMLTTYGFGAKTSSGFGTAEDKLAGKGILALRAELPGLATLTGAASEAEQPVSSLPRYLESPTRLHADFRQPDGSLKLEAEYEAFIKSRGGRYRKKDKQLYEKARRWWEREGRQLAEAATQEPTPEPASTKTPPVTELTFATLGELREVAQRVATQLRNGGGG